MDSKLEKKIEIIENIRLLISYKEQFPIKEVCVMRTGTIDHYIVHFDNFDDMQKYVDLITTMNEYDVVDYIDKVILFYALSIIGKIVYNQYDVLLYKKLINKINNRKKIDITLDVDIESLIIDVDIPAEEVITVIRFSE